MTELINLYSDTVTRPTPEMRQAIANAEVGDDMSGEDPTVNALESMMAEITGKEAAVFACSGTQSNQMGVAAHCVAGDELLIETGGHISNFEAGAPAAISGVSTRFVNGNCGLVDVDDLQGLVRAENQHLCRTRLLCLENTTNMGGGRAYPVEQLHRLGEWAREHGLKSHIDGARLFNAVVSGGHSAAEICQEIDTVSICFSKGLGCPMGSVLVGSAADIQRARRVRKMMGGALRQAGIVAAAAVYAMQHHVERLADDHEHARLFADLVGEIDGIALDQDVVETNIVYLKLDSDRGHANQLAARMLEKGVKIGATSGQRLRICTHLDVGREDMIRAAAVLAECMQEDLANAGPSADPHGPFARA